MRAHLRGEAAFGYLPASMPQERPLRNSAPVSTVPGDATSIPVSIPDHRFHSGTVAARRI